jgi:hypothetical protein
MLIWTREVGSTCLTPRHFAVQSTRQFVLRASFTSSPMEERYSILINHVCRAGHCWLSCNEE